jgi:hypothetical protein
MQASLCARGDGRVRVGLAGRPWRPAMRWPTYDSNFRLGTGRPSAPRLWPNAHFRFDQLPERAVRCDVPRQQHRPLLQDVPGLLPAGLTDDTIEKEPDKPIISRMSAGVIIAAARIAAVVGCSNPGTPTSSGPPPPRLNPRRRRVSVFGVGRRLNVNDGQRVQAVVGVDSTAG